MITGVIKKVFYNANGFISGVLDVDDVTHIPPQPKKCANGTEYSFSGPHLLGTGNLINTKVSLTGEWANHEKYGWAFKCSLISVDVESDLYFFLVNFISGVGSHLARHLVDSFDKKRLAEMFEYDHAALKQVKGIGPVLLERIIESWNKFASMRVLSELLLPAGCSPNMVYKVFKHFEEFDGDVVELIKKNPYTLCDIPGVGFKKADIIALGQGVDPSSHIRIMAALVYSVEMRANSDGHTYSEMSDVIGYLVDDLDIKVEDDGLWEQNFKLLIQQGKLIKIGGTRIALKKHYDAEIFLCNFMKVRATSEITPAVNPASLGDFISNLEKAQGFEYNELQRDAIVRANTQSLFCLAGIAGAGKTTVSAGILSVLGQKFNSDKFFVTALSGIATDRIKKSTGFEGGTIQSLLVKYKEADYIDCSVLVIDEGSMVPSMVLYSLLKKIPQSTVVIFVGDPSQLPPVGPGSPYSDMLDFSRVAKTVLTQPNRQSAKSNIIRVATDIRNGVFPHSLNEGGDFFMVHKKVDNLFQLKKTLSADELKLVKDKVNDEIKAVVFKYFSKRKDDKRAALAKGDFNEYLFGDQLITPQKIGPLGSHAFNAVIQKALQDEGGEIISTSDRLPLKLHDKVLHNSNQDMAFMSLDEFNEDKMDYNPNNKSRIYNGFIGVVVAYDEDAKRVWVYYPLDDKVVIYAYSDVSIYLQLAFGLTVHKTQGAEFINVIMPVSTAFYRMLSSKLLYTGVTRAKSKLCLVGDSYAIKIACERMDFSNRNTILGLLLQTETKGDMLIQ